jgi:hypothetical protein
MHIDGFPFPAPDADRHSGRIEAPHGPAARDQAIMCFLFEGKPLAFNNVRIEWLGAALRRIFYLQ